jgi:hypothetical protein
LGENELDKPQAVNQIIPTDSENPETLEGRSKPSKSEFKDFADQVKNSLDGGQKRRKQTENRPKKPKISKKR